MTLDTAVANPLSYSRPRPVSPTVWQSHCSQFITCWDLCTIPETWPVWLIAIQALSDHAVASLSRADLFAPFRAYLVATGTKTSFCRLIRCVYRPGLAVTHTAPSRHHRRRRRQQSLEQARLPFPSCHKSCSASMANAVKIPKAAEITGSWEGWSRQNCCQAAEHACRG